MSESQESAGRIAAEVRCLQAKFGGILAISVTSRCNIGCAHCARECTAKGEDLPREYVERIARDLPSISSVAREVGITGGEPLLCGDHVRILSEAAAACGCEPCVMTNAFWASSPSEARRVLRSFPALRAIGISTDRYHQRFVPAAKVRTAYEAARELGWAARISVTVCQPPSSEDQAVLEELRAFAGEHVGTQDLTDRGKARDLPEGPSHSTELPPIPCTSPGPMIREDGMMVPCCRGLDRLPEGHPMGIGHVRDTSLAELYGRLQAHAVLHFLRVWGLPPLFKLLKTAGLDGSLPCQHLELSPCSTCAALCASAQVSQHLEFLQNDRWFRLQVATGRYHLMGEAAMLDIMFPPKTSAA